MSTQHADIVHEALRSAPVVTVTGLSIFGVALQDWVYILTIFYVLLQATFLLRDKWWRQRKGKNGRK